MCCMSRQMGHNWRIHFYLLFCNSCEAIKINSTEGLVELFYRRPNRVRLQVTVGPSPVECNTLVHVIHLFDSGFRIKQV